VSQVIVVVGGGTLNAASLAAIDDNALIIAADGGLDHARAADLKPSMVVGDMDSISRAGLDWARDHDVEVRAHPRDKDDTDTALALNAARRSGGRHLLVLGGDGDRLDHTMGTILALGDHANQHFESINALLGTIHISTVFPGRTATLDGTEGTTFSLLALHGACPGVTVVGARWPLHDATLHAGSTRGVSNLITHQATVSVAPYPQGATPITVVIP